jgi:hypothetical protein
MKRLAPKKKAGVRFEQLNLLVDQVLHRLPSLSHRVVLLVGWRHAKPSGEFRASSQQIADAAGISKRQAIRTIDDLVTLGALEVTAQERGSIPRSYRITGRPRGDTMSPSEIC